LRPPLGPGRPPGARRAPAPHHAPGGTAHRLLLVRGGPPPRAQPGRPTGHPLRPAPLLGTGRRDRDARAGGRPSDRLPLRRRGWARSGGAHRPPHRPPPRSRRPGPGDRLRRPLRPVFTTDSRLAFLGMTPTSEVLTIERDGHGATLWRDSTERRHA